MKRGGRLSRSTPLRSRTQLSRSTPAQRATHLTRVPAQRRRARVTPKEARARKAVAARSFGLCEIGDGCRAVDMHHRRNRSQGGEWAADNLLHLCRDHHAWVTVHPAASRVQGWAVTSTRDPGRVPVWLARHGWALLTPDGGWTATTDPRKGEAA